MNDPTVRRGIALITSMLLTFCILRLFLHNWPNTDLNVGQYDVHHLFTGVLLTTVCALRLAVRSAPPRVDGTLVGLGVGLALSLDEWVYLIVTDGSNASYVLPVSLWSGLSLVLLACAYTAWLMHRR